MIDIQHVSVSVGKTPLITDVTLSVNDGEWVTIIGPNGAGKSTLLRTLTRHVPYRGTVTVNGYDTAEMTRRQRARLIASVAQSPAIPPGMRVLDYVLLGRTPHLGFLQNERSADHEIVGETLALLDLVPFRVRALETLSGGERQRVFLARAIAQQTPILLLDEPTTALDIGHQQEVLERVDELRISRGLTVVSTMHDLPLAGEYADRIVLMSEGAIRADGRAAEILTEANIARYYNATVRVTRSADGTAIMPVRRPSSSRR